MASVPTLMVSSTFYDLRQIRKDLEEFISVQLGYECLLSELPSFPVDPDANTIENCRRRVEEQADILVLVIGGRYGSIDKDSDKSITNLEYLMARKKGIPVYAFVAKNILDIMPVWEKNLNGDYSNVVDTPRLFEFVKQVKDQEHVWIFPFETAQDIVHTLRVQLAHLFATSLKLWMRLSWDAIPSYMESLSPVALRIALERPPLWENHLFLQVWSDEVNKRKPLIREYDSSLRIGTAESVFAVEAADWLQTRFHELRGLANSFEELFNKSLIEAYGAQGKPGNPEYIIWTARKLGEILDEAIRWSLRIRRAHIAEPFSEPAVEVAKFSEDFILKLSQTPSDALREFETAKKEMKTKGVQPRKITLELEIRNMDRFLEAIEEAERKYTEGL